MKFQIPQYAMKPQYFIVQNFQCHFLFSSYVAFYYLGLYYVAHLCSCLLPVLRSLKESFDQAIQRDDVKAIVVTGIAMSMCF